MRPERRAVLLLVAVWFGWAANEIPPEQVARNRDIEVTGIPEFPDEDLPAIMLQLANTLGLKGARVVAAVRERVGEIARAARPDYVIVTLPDSADKPLWVNASRNYYYLTAREVDPTFEPRPITIDEYLVPSIKRLLASLRCFAKKHCYKDIWTVDGAVYIRRDENSERFRIENERDIEKLSTEPIFK